MGAFGWRVVWFGGWGGRGGKGEILVGPGPPNSYLVDLERK